MGCRQSIFRRYQSHPSAPSAPGSPCPRAKLSSSCSQLKFRFFFIYPFSSFSATTFVGVFQSFSFILTYLPTYLRFSVPTLCFRIRVTARGHGVVLPIQYAGTLLRERRHPRACPDSHDSVRYLCQDSSHGSKPDKERERVIEWVSVSYRDLVKPVSRNYQSAATSLRVNCCLLSKSSSD